MKLSHTAFLGCVTMFFVRVCCRIHTLNVEDDYRSYIALTSFGFYEGGYLLIKLDKFFFKSDRKDTLFGFTLKKVLNDGIDPHLENYRDRCILRDVEKVIENKEKVIFLIMDIENQRLKINCSAFSEVEKLRIYADRAQLLNTFNSGRKKHDSNKNSEGASCANFSLPITVNKNNITDQTYYTTTFVVFIPTEREEGLYELFFHSCDNYKEVTVVTSFSISIEERNVGNYLSAGEMPLPVLYFIMSIIFFLSTLFWMYILRKSRQSVFKIHYLMAALVLLKSFGLLFHSINYHYIEVTGMHVATWARLYYVTHLLKGSVLFITIILIGTGWTFIKHILSQKDKKIFMIVIPLQVFANVAEIILEESEEGDAEHKMWLNVFTFVDLICCVAILFPIVWSIKHLQDASQTVGKAAINLEKLKLFRHFYITIVCYVYFTRIIVYLLKMTVPFRYEWLDEMFKEIATFVLFVLTGYKFRPASANPYFLRPEDVNETDIMVNQYGLTEGLTKLSRISNETADGDKDTLLIYKRESSYDYD